MPPVAADDAAAARSMRCGRSSTSPRVTAGLGPSVESRGRGGLVPLPFALAGDAPATPGRTRPRRGRCGRRRPSRPGSCARSTGAPAWPGRDSCARSRRSTAWCWTGSAAPSADAAGRYGRAHAARRPPPGCTLRRPRPRRPRLRERRLLPARVGARGPTPAARRRERGAPPRPTRARAARVRACRRARAPRPLAAPLARLVARTDGARARGRADARVPRARARGAACRLARFGPVARGRHRGRGDGRVRLGACDSARARPARAVRSGPSRRADRLLECPRHPRRPGPAPVRRVRHGRRHSGPCVRPPRSARSSLRRSRSRTAAGRCSRSQAVRSRLSSCFRSEFAAFRCSCRRCSVPSEEHS